jgi:hypothetical protein
VASTEDTSPGGGQRAAHAFSVDVPGLLEALTEQFPEPLLCVRELVQNAADAGARRIDIEVSHDRARGLARLAVRDDGRGMGAGDVEGYLTIGFSEKDPGQHRGRFGIGKLSPYALGFERMLVDTSTGTEATRIELLPDGTGEVTPRLAGPPGTEVRVYTRACRDEAEQLSKRVFDIARESCGSIGIPLLVNGQAVNQPLGLPTRYALHFETAAGAGVIGVGAEPVRILSSGGIVLETGAPILGPEVSYVLDGPCLAPTLSRNAVRRDGAFDALLQDAQAAARELTAVASRRLGERVEELRREQTAVERVLDADDRSALEWLRDRLLDPEGEPTPEVKAAPVLETADGDLVSASALVELLRCEGRIPSSRVPLACSDIAGYVDRGLPVLLLYRDLEDFLERQHIETLEVDGSGEGVEVGRGELDAGEAALIEQLRLAPPPRSGIDPRGLGVAAFAAVAAGAAVFLVGAEGSAPEGVPAAAARVAETASAPPRAADVGAAPSPLVAVLAGVSSLLAILSVAAGGGLALAGARRRQGMKAWLRTEAGVPVAAGDDGRRKLAIFFRKLLHPIDFAVARAWSLRAAAAPRPPSSDRAFTGEPKIRAGARLDLDRLELGIIELVSTSGDPTDAKVFVVRGERVLLNRNHPTIRDLALIASADPARARVLLEALMATDGELARHCDPRQVEWDLVARAPRVLGEPRG